MKTTSGGFIKNKYSIYLVKAVIESLGLQEARAEGGRELQDLERDVEGRRRSEAGSDGDEGAGGHNIVQ